VTRFPGSSYAGKPLIGTVQVPGDKSISHRVVLFAALAHGTSHLRGVLNSYDVQATIAAVQSLGAQVELYADEAGISGTVTGFGKAGASTALICSQPSSNTVILGAQRREFMPEPQGEGTLNQSRDARHTSPLTIDCANSGTTARLLLGLLSGYGATVTLTGDASLSRRPMHRVTAPLARMGAHFSTTLQGTLPLTVTGTPQLAAIDYVSPVASAQVKSALLLAGMGAAGTTTVTEPSKSRDHTELLLPAFGVDVTVDGLTVGIAGGQQAHACDCDVPGDPSSAAFLLVAAALTPGSEVTATNLSLNPTRTGFLTVLERMGANIVIQTSNNKALGAEQTGQVTAAYSPNLRATVVKAQEIPTLIDEIPILALLAAAASGTTVFRQVGELRVKESDRLAAIIEGLDTLGCRAYADGDDLFVVGDAALAGSASRVGGAAPAEDALLAGGASQAVSATLPERKVLPQDGRTKDARPLLQTRGDHRLAMTWAVAARALDLNLEIQGIESAAVSYPNFLEDLKGLS